MTTSSTSSETTIRRNLTVFDLLNGARLVGEAVPGFDRNQVVNPAIVTVAKDEGAEDKFKININPVLFAGGTIYTVSSQAVLASYQCFDQTLHQLYTQTTNKKDTESNADANGSDGGAELGAATADA